MSAVSQPPSDNPTVTAARWLVDQPAGNRRAIPELRERFGLSALQACEAIAMARNGRPENSEGGIE